MEANKLEEVSDIEKKILSYLLNHQLASAYELAKNTGHSYSTVHAATKRLTEQNLVFPTKVKSEKGGRKFLFLLTAQGKEMVCFPENAESNSYSVKESTPNPLDDVMIDFLLSQKRETAEIDFKFTLDTTKESRSCPKIAKDIFAMSNYGGGYLLFGFKEENGTFNPVGIPPNFDLEQARVQEKFNSYSNDPLPIDYRVVTRNTNGEDRKFAVMYIPPSQKVLCPKKDGIYFEDDNKQKKAFSANDILIRRGTQSIPASENEIAFIKRRSQETNYRIGLLEGRPDRISENLFANFFRVADLPKFVYEARLPDNISFGFWEIKHTPFLRAGTGTIYSFYEMSIPPLGNYIVKNSLRRYAFSDFLNSQDSKTVLKRLLDYEIRRTAIDIGLRFDYNDKHVFFYPSDFQEKTISWEGRYKRSSRYVVKRVFLQQEGTSVYIHSAAELSFRFLGNEVFLEILPKIVLTYDGMNPIESSRGGPVKTRLTHNQFNDAYLNHVLFWASRFRTKNVLRLKFGEHILVYAQPVTVSLNVGIRSDRPSLEFAKRRDELYSLEELEIDQ